MFKPILRFTNKTIVLCIVIFSFLTLALAIAIGALAWKLSKEPISLAFAKGYVQEALSSTQDGLNVTFDDIVLTWPKLGGRLELDLTGLRISKGEETTDSLFIKHASVGLSRRYLMFGRIRPLSVIIKNPSLELVRSKNGDMEVFIQNKDSNTDVENATKKPFGEGVADIFTDMARNKKGSFFARLDEFKMIDASIAIRDQEFGLSWYLTDFDFNLEENQDFVNASMDIVLPGGVDKEARFTFDIAYRKKHDDFLTKGKVDNLNPYFISKFLPVPETFAGQNLFFSGDITASMDNKMVVQNMEFNAKIPEGSIFIPSEFDAPISLKQIALKSQYDIKDKIFSIKEVSGDIGGISFQGNGSFISREDGFSFPIKLSMGTLTSEQILSVFPKSEINGDAYEWLGKNIQNATYNDVVLDMDILAKKTRDEELQRDTWDISTPKLNLDFAFENAKVIYSDTLMPIEDASGSGRFDWANETLDVVGNTAKIGDITGTDITVNVTDLLKEAAGFVTVKAKLNGPVSTALSYIAADPINMTKDDIGIDAAKVAGNISADLEIGMPTLKDVPKEKVNVSINATLNDMNVPDIVNGLPLSGGPLSLITEEGGFKIKGSAQLAGRDVVLDWHQYFESKGNPYSMKIAASIGADQELRNHFGIDLDDYISGTMPVDLVYMSKANGEATVDVKGNLNPIRIYINPFKFTKPVGTEGALSLKAFLKDDVLKQLSDVNIASKNFVVSDAAITFAPMNGKQAELFKGTFPKITLGNTNMTASFDVNDKNIMQVKIDSNQFDMTPFLDDAPVDKGQGGIGTNKPKQKQQPMNINLNANKMLFKNNQEAAGGIANINLDDEGEIAFDSIIGKSPLRVRFAPDATGKRTFLLDTKDAGNFLYAFGLYDNVHGGYLRIYGEPKGQDLRGNLYGTMQMENFRVVKAPALASLLSLMSLSGVNDLLNNEGIVFSKLESGFEWRFRDTGNLLIVKNGKTSGSSIGLTFNGFIDRGQQKTDIAGTIIPMTEVNSLLSKIPLVGDILGGASGLIAATYSMKGPSSEPKITVNPLSVLAPGIIRRILFEGGFEQNIPDDEPKEKISPNAVTAPPSSQKNVGTN